MPRKSPHSSGNPSPLCCQDIILTVKEKLSIRSIEYFALALEEQFSASRLHLLHEEELIQQVGGPAEGALGRPGSSATSGLGLVYSLSLRTVGKDSGLVCICSHEVGRAQSKTPVLQV